MNLKERIFFIFHPKMMFVMRAFLVNFVYNSAGQYNADFVLFTGETFPTSREINQRIQSAAIEKGLQFHGALLWTGIKELNESDEHQFNPEEEEE